jgi:hypothetical protein
MLIPYLISHITQASFSEFIIDGHHFTSPNQQNPPPTISFSDSESLPASEHPSPAILRRRVWALQDYPYIPFILNSPFHGAITSRLAIPPVLEQNKSEYHIPSEVAKSWMSLERSCRKAAAVLHSSFGRTHSKNP